MAVDNYSVYIHTSPSNKIYVGITSKKPEVRWNKGFGYYSNPHFYNAIKKYGWENIKHEIVATQLSFYEACQLEILLIENIKQTTVNMDIIVARVVSLQANILFQMKQELSFQKHKRKKDFGKERIISHMENLQAKDCLQKFTMSG